MRVERAAGLGGGMKEMSGIPMRTVWSLRNK